MSNTVHILGDKIRQFELLKKTEKEINISSNTVGSERDLWIWKIHIDFQSNNQFDKLNQEM